MEGTQVISSFIKIYSVPNILLGAEDNKMDIMHIFLKLRAMLHKRKPASK